MKILALITELQRLADAHGDIPVQLQNTPSEPDLIDYEQFFIVPEEYEDGMYINLRSWPY